MNEELRQVQRADDPALAFLTKSHHKTKSRRPVYKGAFAPNRFSIRPGFRWDGVERSTGFEAKYFQRINDRKLHQADAQAWRQEDM